MRIYHHPMSSNARRAIMAAYQLGLEPELVLVDLTKGEHRQPKYLALNPAGKVPVLDDDGFILTESHAIMQYLAEKTPGQTIYPAGSKERAEVNRWMFWSAHQLAPCVALLNWEHLIKGLLGLGAAEPAIVARGEALVTEALRTLDQHLATREWIAAGQLTLADLAIAATLMYTQAAKLPTNEHPNVVAWFDRIRALDAWKKTDL